MYAYYQVAFQFYYTECRNKYKIFLHSVMHSVQLLNNQLLTTRRLAVCVLRQSVYTLSSPVLERSLVLKFPVVCFSFTGFESTNNPCTLTKTLSQIYYFQRSTLGGSAWSFGFFHPRHNGQWPPTSKDFLSPILSITFIFLS